MSLAMFASEFISESDNNNNNNNLMQQKKQEHNRRQPLSNRNVPNNVSNNVPNKKIRTDKVNSVLESIHNNTKSMSPSYESLAEYGSIPPNPTSMGSEKAMLRENMQVQDVPTPFDNEEETLDLNNYQQNYGTTESNQEYYKKYIPQFNPNIVPVKKDSQNYYHMIQQNQTNQTNQTNKDVLLEKLNYMIHLLEEKQEEKTNNVTEEVILYSFLGIFIIFIVDSFTKLGKYTR